ncbi:hypothetical protein, partial [Lactococcus lactis]
SYLCPLCLFSKFYTKIDFLENFATEPSVMSRRFNKPATTVDYRQRPNKPLGYWTDLAHKKFRF